MVCIACMAVPLLLVVWVFLIQSLVTKWWQCRKKLKGEKVEGEPPQLVKECKNGVCTLAWKKDQEDVKKTD